MAALRAYRGQVLAVDPQLSFELSDVRVGYKCLTILYRNHRGQQGAETFEFGAEDKVIRSFAGLG
jgi:hypothetical protein